MTNLTALIIATREDIVVDAGGPDSNGKYTGWITLGVEDRFRPLINSDAGLRQQGLLRMPDSYSG
jgi:hypothetical protein